VAILEAMRVMKEQNVPHGDIQVVFTIAEEGGLNGSKNIDKSLLKSSIGFILDSSGAPGEIIMMAPGQNKLEIVVQGKTAHAGVAPEDGVNAIIVAAKAMAELKDGRIDFETTANVGNIKGGGATNIVPEKVAIVAEARSRNLEKLAAQTQHMVETFERVAAANGAKAQITVTKAYDPFVLTEEMPVVKLSKQAIQAIGLEPVLKGTGGGSDANFFNIYGIPSVVLGVGMNKVHTTDEFIKEADLYKTGELVISIIRQSVDC
jgi:tripeptide aminopeptidase